MTTHRRRVPRLLVAVVEDGLLGDEPVAASHLSEDVSHPVLDATLGRHVRPELHHLALGADHRRRQRLIVGALLEAQRRDVVVHLSTEQQSTVSGSRVDGGDGVSSSSESAAVPITSHHVLLQALTD